MAIKILILVVLAGIVISLGSGLYFLARDESDSRRMVTALTIRIGLSVALFVLIMVAYFNGLITPHGVMPRGLPGG